MKDLSPASSDLSLLQNLSFNLGGIAEVDTVGEADIVSTGRIETVHHPVVTKVALLDFPDLLVKGNGIIRTGLYTAIATGDTPLCLLYGHVLCQPFLNLIEVLDSLLSFQTGHVRSRGWVVLPFLWGLNGCQFNISIQSKVLALIYRSIDIAACLPSAIASITV